MRTRRANSDGRAWCPFVCSSCFHQLTGWRTLMRPPSTTRHRKPYREATTCVTMLLVLLSNLYLTSQLFWLPCSAQESPAPAFAFFEEPQPFVYMALNFDSGSGDGYPASKARTPSQPHDIGSPINQLESSSDSNPSLITAKCWDNSNNNYPGLDQCRQLNVITAPQAGSNKQESDDDSLITPVVVFESASALDSGSQMAPPYFTSTWSPEINNNILQRFRPTTTRAPMSSPATARPTVRPTSRLHVATPRPTTTSTTPGRQCRDENDEDCDEPEDLQQTKLSHDEDGDDSGNDDDADDDNQADDRRQEADDRLLSSSLRPTFNQSINSIEVGSGSGPTDDNDGGDDGDENIETSSGLSEAPTSAQTTRYIEVSTISTTKQPQHTATPTGLPSHAPLPAPKQQPPSTTARIEVVVHPTLPPAFPVTTTPKPPETESSQAPVDLTDPNDTFTSLPVFPASVSSLSSPDYDDDSNGRAGSERQQPSAELDLATFKPIPFALGEHQRRLTQSSTQNSFQPDYISSTSTQISQEVYRPSSTTSRFENPWQHSSSTRPPPLRPPAPAELPIRLNPGAEPVTTKIGGTDVLTQMLLYASLVILTVTALIFILMALTLWRRNSARQRAFLQKSQQILTGRNNQMVASLSQANQLLPNSHSQGPGPTGVPLTSHRQPGLLSTYAPGKGMTLGKVTTSLVKYSDDNLLNDQVEATDDERNKDQLGYEQNAEGRHPTGHGVSWSNSTTTTTTTSNSHTSSQRPDQLPAQANSQATELVNNPNRPNHSNSLSDARQNSSSISDSQASPEATMRHPNVPGQPAHFAADSNGRRLPPSGDPYVQMQPPPPPSSGPSYNQFGSPMQVRPMSGQMQHYDKRHWSNQYPPAMTPFRGPLLDGHFGPSRSVEDLHRSASVDGGPDWHHQKGNGIVRYPVPPFGPPKQPRHPQQQMIYPVHDANLYPYGPPPHASQVASNPLATMARGVYGPRYRNPSYEGGQPIDYPPEPPPVVGRRDHSEAWYV